MSTTNNSNNSNKPARKRDLRMTPKAGYSVKRRRLSSGGKYS